MVVKINKSDCFPGRAVSFLCLLDGDVDTARVQLAGVEGVPAPRQERVVRGEAGWQLHAVASVETGGAASFVIGSCDGRVEPVRVGGTSPSCFTAGAHGDGIAPLVGADTRAWHDIVLEALFQGGHVGGRWRGSGGGEKGDQRVIGAHSHAVSPFVVGLPAGFEGDDLPSGICFFNSAPTSADSVVVVTAVLSARSHGKGGHSGLCERLRTRTVAATGSGRRRDVFQRAMGAPVLRVFEGDLGSRARGRQVPVACDGGSGGGDDGGFEHLGGLW